MPRRVVASALNHMDLWVTRGLPKPPLQTESKFERAIKQAKRPDCKDGVPGGLLAPIFLAMDKKDSGCKW